MIRHPFITAQVSLIGDRKVNQDRCTILEYEENLLVVLGDGMGGHPRGEMASQILMETAEQQLYRTPHPILSPGGFLTRLLHKAHENIMAYGYDQDPPIDPRTTAVVCLIQENTAYWAHAGDSRLYLFRDQGVLFRTTDDSYVERLQQQGMISESEKEKHPNRNYVTRCLGGAMISPEITLGSEALQAGDKLLLCTDGLWGSIDEPELLSTMVSQAELDDITLSLAETATQNAYPESDNVTLLTVELGEAIETQDPVMDQLDSEEQREDELNSAIADLQSAIDSFHNKYNEDQS